MYRKILVPLDGSPRAEAILLPVIELACRLSAEVILLQVIEPLPSRVTSGATSALAATHIYELTTAAEAYLAGIRDQFAAEGVCARMLVLNGPVEEQILAAADREHVDLIAIASHGRGGLALLFYGSVAAALLQRASQPLLMVRSRDAK